MNLLLYTRGIFVLALILFLSTHSHAAEKAKSAPAPKKIEQADKIAKELLVAMGGESFSRQMMQSIINAYKPRFPNATEAFWTGFAKEINPNEFIDLMVPLYAKHFTVDEMKKIIAFYKTPPGKKLGQAFPQIVQEATPIGQGWGLSLGLKAMEKLRAEEAAKAKEKETPPAK